MKSLIVILCFAAQLFLSSVVQAWSFTDTYRGFSGFGVDCQVIAATDEEGQKKDSNKKATQEEEPDCE